MTSAFGRRAQENRRTRESVDNGVKGRHTDGDQLRSGCCFGRPTNGLRDGDDLRLRLIACYKSRLIRRTNGSNNEQNINKGCKSLPLLSASRSLATRDDGWLAAAACWLTGGLDDLNEPPNKPLIQSQSAALAEPTESLLSLSLS